MQNRPEYWAELNTFLPWRYRHRTALSPAFTLQVSGSLSGTRQKATLYRIKPEGRLVRTWSQKFDVRKGTAPGSARYKALLLFVEASRKDPKVSRRVTIQDAMETAEAILTNH